MRFSQSFLEMLHPETAKLLHRADYMIDAGAEEVVRTNAWIKATDCAYARQEWPAYIGAVYYAFWSMLCCDGRYLKRLLQYSNDVIRFGKEHLEEACIAAGRFSGWAGRTYVNTYTYIYMFYDSYYQITDEKIDELMALYEHWYKTRLSTSTEFHYMYTKMQRSVELRDAKQTAICLRRVQALLREAEVCYVCQSMEIVNALVFLDREEEALQIIRQIIGDEGLPEGWYEDFANCENANAYEQYQSLIRHTFWHYTPDRLRRYVLEFQNEILYADRESVDWDMELMMLTILRGADVRRAEYLEEISNVYDNLKEHTPLDQLHFLISAWGYLEMLHRSGIETVPLTLLKPPIDQQDGVYNTHALANYFLKKSDALGAKFDQARPSFHYAELRSTAFAMLDPD